MADALSEHDSADVVEDQDQQAHEQHNLEGFSEGLHDQKELLEHPEKADDSQNAHEAEHSEHSHSLKLVQVRAGGVSTGEQRQNPQIQSSARHQREVEAVPRLGEVRFAHDAHSQHHLDQENRVEEIFEKGERASSKLGLQADDEGVADDHEADDHVELIALNIQPCVQLLLPCWLICFPIVLQLAVFGLGIFRFVLLPVVRPSA
mmetsp:Transcript_27744/g.60282  ORF Transcript_27744/g.60282 Transcript_27744/m.60282 type:complete len:205 (-) Transcript_27744:161-775(-)